jgi:hypothetical protein
MLKWTLTKMAEAAIALFLIATPFFFGKYLADMSWFGWESRMLAAGALFTAAFLLFGESYGEEGRRLPRVLDFDARIELSISITMAFLVGSLLRTGILSIPLAVAIVASALLWTLLHVFSGPVCGWETALFSFQDSEVVREKQKIRLHRK